VLQPALRWAESIRSGDSIVSFNYDTIVERALTRLGKTWNHATSRESDSGVPVHKLHGSIDWISIDRLSSWSKLDLLFEKENVNRTEASTGNAEDDLRLWRCRSASQMRRGVRARDLQLVRKNGVPSRLGIAGLGAYKQLHQVPGLGVVWANGMKALYEADKAIVVGFSMSDFDVMAQLQFVEVVRQREKKGRPLKVFVVDPFIRPESKRRFRQVFKRVTFIAEHHEKCDWGMF